MEAYAACVSVVTVGNLNGKKGTAQSRAGAPTKATAAVNL